MASNSSGTKRTGSMKQSTLLFHAVKRTGSGNANNTDKTVTARPPRSPVKQSKKPTRSSDSSESEVGSIEITSSEEEEVEDFEETEEKQLRRTITVDTSDSDEEDVKVNANSLLVVSAGKQKEQAPSVAELNPKDPRWRPLYKVAVQQMGTNKPGASLLRLPSHPQLMCSIPVHAEKDDKVHDILRVFDMYAT